MIYNKEKNPGWNFDNSYINLPNKLFTKTSPTPVSNPKTIILNKQLAKDIGLNIDFLLSENGLAVLAGNNTPEETITLAQAYAGHQFGHFTMLGDGRAILIGEQITPKGERLDIQLKGSGKTPYSRNGDGRAALGPMLREYIISEALHGLKIPTTRSLAVVKTDEKIIRERYLPGAILTRVASSHIRVGTFQYISAFGTQDELKQLADYTIKRHYPNIEYIDNKYLLLIREMAKRQSSLIAKWQLIGFIHGVMNTDNMTISGEAIDFGPCAFMDIYDPDTKFSSIDRNGRYAYGKQPSIGAWNIARFAETLLPLIHDNKEEAIKLANDEIARFYINVNSFWINGMRAKLGIFNEEIEDENLVNELLDLIKNTKTDFTNTFKSLTINKLNVMQIFKTIEFVKWQEKWMARLDRQKESKLESEELMKSNNPSVIPRNHRVEEALEAADNNDFSLMHKLNNILSNPYEYSSEQDEYSLLPKDVQANYMTFCGT